LTTDIRIHVDRARSAAIGPEHGITPRDLKAIEADLKKAHRALRTGRREKHHGFFDLHKDKATLEHVQTKANEFRVRDYDNLVILGIGGSSLGTITLASALKPPYYNLLSKAERQGAPRLFVMDNVDPDTFAAMMKVCPPRNTLYNVISKSGGTAEIAAQLLIVLEALEGELGKSALKDHLVVTVGPQDKRAKKTLLHDLKERYQLDGFEVPANVGGRFSVFTPVGLFPAAMLGLDLQALAAGCAAMDKRCSKPSIADNPAYLRAAIQFLANTQKGKAISVMMPYSDCLRDIADWYRQLWAESLGKRTSLDGQNNDLFTGQTPIKALGVTDQHSQLQLYLEGPNDKIHTILEQRNFNTTLRIPQAPSSVPGLEYLQGQTMNKLMAAERKATIDALTEAKRPVMRIVLPKVNEHTLAQLLYLLEVETAMAGRLFNVDAFDQPAVERIKVLTRQNMGERK